MEEQGGMQAGEGRAGAGEEVTRLLQVAEAGDPRAAAELLPVVYQELRELARARMAGTPPGNTLQPTALVHEAYLRLVRSDEERDWKGRSYFFAAAAEGMRQILVEQVRRKQALKHGGANQRVDADADVEFAIESSGDELMAVHEALAKLEEDDPEKAAIVKLRYFAGMTREETARSLGMSLRTCDRHWRYIVARLHRDLGGA